MSTWKRVVPEVSRKGDLIEHGSLECQEKTQYRWVNLNPKIDWVCVGTTKYYKQKEQVSNDYGQTWGDVIPYQYQRGAAYETHSTDCGYVPPTPQYRWVNMDISTDWICDGTTKYYKQKKQVSYDEGQTWQDVTPPEYQRGDVYETQSTDCGYVPPTGTKFQATYSGGQTYEKECDGNATLTTGDTNPSGYEYTAMTSAVIGDCITTIGTLTFNGNYPFRDYYNLSRVNSEIEGECNIPDGIETIGNYAFDGCNKLYKLSLPNSLKNIGNHAFSSFDDENGFSRVNSETDGECNIPAGVEFIDDGAFFYNNDLTNINIPSSVNYIGNNPFDSCRGIVAITVNQNNTYYDSRNSCNAIIKTSTNELISGCKNTIIPNDVTSINFAAFRGATDLTGITIPNNVTVIGDAAFQSCESLTSINIPTGVTSIGDYTFASCYSLTSVTIPNSITSIGWEAFYHCYSLTGITIPNNVTSIDYYAFGGCRSLTEITCLSLVPPTLDADAFYNTNNCPIYVPANSVNAYKTASGWSTYASRIQAIP